MTNEDSKEKEVRKNESIVTRPTSSSGSSGSGEQGEITKNEQWLSKVCAETWTIEKVFDPGRYAKNDQFHLVLRGTHEIARIVHHIYPSGKHVDIGFTNIFFTPNWFTLKNHKLLIVHSLYEFNHELILKFDLSGTRDYKFEYYANTVPIPSASSHGRGGGGN